MSRARVLGAVLALAAPAFVAAQLGPPPSDADLNRYLAQVVYGAEFGSGSAVLQAWPRSSLTWCYLGLDATVHAEVVATLAALDRYMGTLEIVEVLDPRDAALVVYCTPLAAYPDKEYIHERGVEGFAVLRTRGPDLVTGTVWLSPAAMAGPSRTRTIREELFQAMGFCGDASGGLRSITSLDDRTIDQYTMLDLTALVIAYQPGRPRYLTREAFKPFLDLMVATSRR